MEPSFWHERWERDTIAFHQGRPNPRLEANFERLGLEPGEEVLVPLCGKAVDLRWLRDRGCRVTGVELSLIAVRDFFREQGIDAVERRSGGFTVLEGGGITLWCGDFFDLDEGVLAGCAAVYDRAALVALPTALRERYAARLRDAVAAGVRMLLVTLEYAQHEMDGPPFSVSPAEVQRLYGSGAVVEHVEDREVLDSESALASRGLSELREHAFLVTSDPCPSAPDAPSRSG